MTKAVKAEIVKPSRKVVSEARTTDADLQITVAGLTSNIVDLGKLITKMKDKLLWRWVVNPETTHEFKSWEEYAKCRLGKISHTKLAELALVGSLTEGEHALSPEMVNAIGHKRCVLLAKVPAAERASLVKVALNGTPEEYATVVQEAINKTVPEDRKKEPTILFARNYPVSVIKRFKDLEKRSFGLPIIRDNDFSISQEAKFLMALIAFFEAGNVEELREADRWLAKKERATVAQA